MTFLNAAPSGSDPCMVDVTILLNSYNPSDDDWIRLLNFVTSLIRLLPIGNQATRLALVTTYNYGKAIHRFADEQNANEIEVKIWNLQKYLLGSHYADGELRFVRTMIFNQTAGDRANVHNVLIMIISTSPSSGLDQSLRREVLQLQHIGTVIPIALSNDVDDETLSLFATNPQSSFRVQNYSMLNDISGNVIRAGCKRTNV